MSNIIALIRFDDGKLYHDAEDLKEVAKVHESAARTIHALISQAGGQIVTTIKGDVAAELPYDKAEVLRDISDILTDKYRLIAHIGVGEDTLEASKALSVAVDQKKAIKVYTPDIRTGEQTVAVSEEDEMLKSEDMNLSAQEKAQIAEILSSIQQNKDAIEEIKETSPEAYAGIAGIISSIAEMIEASKASEEKASDRVVSDINKTLEDHKKKYINEKEKAILRAIRQNKEDSHEGIQSDNNDVIAKSSYDRSSTGNPDEEASALQKAKVPQGLQQKAIEALKLVHMNKDKFKDMHLKNPNVGPALAALVKILSGMLQKQTGENVESHMGQAEIEHHLQNEKVHPVRTHQDKRVTHPLPHYAPGSIRQYAPGKARQKTEEGQWRTFSGQPKVQE
jgi:archaeosine-15-forming tRNA-guanine transglycosylase